MFGRPIVARSLFDASRRAPRLAGRGLIKVYRYTLSPLVGFDCRHLPTCSDYADQALERFGLWAGGWMTLARLLRCQPWGTSGLDFVAGGVAAGIALVYAVALSDAGAGRTPVPDASHLPGRNAAKHVKSSTLTCARSQE